MAQLRIPKPKHDLQYYLNLTLMLLVGILLLAIIFLGSWIVADWLAQTPELLEPATIPVIAPPPAPQPSIRIAPNAGPPGARLTVWGQGWAPDESVNLCLDDLGSDAEPLVYATARANSNGQFTAFFDVPGDATWLSLPAISVLAESQNRPANARTLFNLAQPTATPTPTPSPTLTPTPACVYDMAFVADVTIPDDSILLRGSGFVKTWRIRNSGSCNWPAGTTWVFAGGHQMAGPDAVPVPATRPGETADISVNLIAPGTTGTHTGYWSLRFPDGTVLDKRFYVRIISQEPTPVPTITHTPRPTATPVPEPPITNWRGSYYSNRTLTGPVVLVRDDASISFNWGAGSPSSALPADDFSAAWTRNLYFEGGNYRFYALSDDGVRVWLDGSIIIDEWHDAAGAAYQADRLVSTGNHDVRVEYFEHGGLAQIQFWWQRVDVYADWRGEYYSNRHLQSPPVMVRDDKSIHFDWDYDSPSRAIPDDNFSVRWTRTVDFDAGTYRFRARMDDGMRVYVDNDLVIDEWRDGVWREVSEERWLSDGNHTLRVEYFERGGRARARFSWESVEGYPDWRGEYWSNRSLNGSPTLVRNDREIDFEWYLRAPHPDLPTDNFSVRWTQRISFENGLYRLYARADDGVRVYVDGKRIINHWRDSSGNTTYDHEMVLDGRHKIVVEYYEHLFNSEVRFWYRRLGDAPTATPVATSTLEPTHTPLPTATWTPVPSPIIVTPTFTPTTETISARSMTLQQRPVRMEV